MGTTNSSLRVRVTSICNMNCDFCHDEGGDKSCQVTRNQIAECIEFAREHGFNKIHLTGGEPSLHPCLTKYIRAIIGAGISCGMTTNGQFQPRLLLELKEAGITSLNFSIHTIDSTAWSDIQQDQDLDKSKRQIARTFSNLRLSVSLGIRTKANIAVGDNPQLAIDLIDELRSSEVEVRLLSILGMDESLVSICDILSHYKARRIEETRIMGSSQYRMTYESTVGTLTVKDIFQYREITVCKECTEKCEEGFYGIRLIPMGDQMYARLCVHKSTNRTMMSLTDFRTSIQLAAIKESSGLNAQLRR